MTNFIEQLPWLIGLIAVVFVIGATNVLVNKAHKKRRYDAKVKAGLVKEGEEIPQESQAEKMKKMEEAIKLAKRTKD